VNLLASRFIGAYMQVVQDNTYSSYCWICLGLLQGRLAFITLTHLQCRPALTLRPAHSPYIKSSYMFLCYTMHRPAHGLHTSQHPPYILTGQPLSTHQLGAPASTYPTHRPVTRYHSARGVGQHYYYTSGRPPSTHTGQYTLYGHFERPEYWFYVVF
jgi:hypothetical protein